MHKMLLDTDILIDHLRGTITSVLSPDQVSRSVISFFTVGELMQGARNTAEMNLISDFTSLFSINWGSAKIHKLAVQLLSMYSLSNGLRMGDAIIAATAISLHLPLHTNNQKHFLPIAELNVREGKQVR